MQMYSRFVGSYVVCKMRDENYNPYVQTEGVGPHANVSIYYV